MPDPDKTPAYQHQCFCGRERILVDKDEKPPLTDAEMALQFHCLMSRAGDWIFCFDRGETWVRMADSKRPGALLPTL